MNINDSPSNLPINKTDKTSQTSAKTEGTASKKELVGLAREGKPSIIFTKQANPSTALVNANFTNMNQVIKKTLVSLFDSLLHDSKIKEVKVNREDEIKAFFKEFKPEHTKEDGRVINERKYIKKTLNEMFSIIDEASKLPKSERQECLNKFMDIVHSKDFSAKLGPNTMQNMLNAAMAYRNKVITD